MGNMINYSPDFFFGITLCIASRHVGVVRHTERERESFWGDAIDSYDSALKTWDVMLKKVTARGYKQCLSSKHYVYL